MTSDPKKTFASPGSLARIEHIRSYIEKRGTTTTAHVRKLTGLKNRQAAAFMRHMESIGVIRCKVPTTYHQGGSSAIIWEINAEPVCNKVQRDPLVAALFGAAPARTLTLENHD